MWNASWVQSLALPIPVEAWGWSLADAGLDLAVWFAACAALGVTLAWLRTLARRTLDAPPPGSHRVRGTLARQGDALARA